jgi:hypothetical protein
MKNEFSTGHAFMYCVFTLITVIKKRGDFSFPTFIDFIDYEKAFDFHERCKGDIVSKVLPIT